MVARREGYIESSLPLLVVMRVWIDYACVNRILLGVDGESYDNHEVCIRSSKFVEPYGRRK